MVTTTLTSVREGGDWPSVIGNTKDQFYLGVESVSHLFMSVVRINKWLLGCGSMLVMALAHARKSGDGRLIVTYYDLLHQWADFLVANSLELNA